jgi:hypothetical protein
VSLFSRDRDPEGVIVMKEIPKLRCWLEAGLALASGASLVAVLIVPRWLEAVFGVDPDHGSGAVEWAVPLLLALVLAFSAGFAWRDLTRLLTGVGPAARPSSGSERS